MSGRRFDRTDRPVDDAAFEVDVREVLADRGRTTNGDVRALLDDLVHLPARGGGRQSWIAGAAAVAVLIGAAAFVAGWISLPAIGGPSPTDPTRFAGDPRLDGPKAIAPSPGAVPAPVTTVTPITPEPGPAWAGDARAALTCAGDPTLFETRNAPGTDAGAGPTPADVLDSFLQSFQFSVDPLPIAGYVEKEATDTARLEVVDVDGNGKAAIVISKSASGTNGPWVVSSVAGCPESELDPTTPTGAHRIGRWTDASGSEVPTSILAASADCYLGTQVRLDGRLYVRIPKGGVDASVLESTWARDIRVPADAIATPYRSGDLRLFVGASGRGIYIATAGRGERLPHVTGDEVVRTDCN